MTMTTNESHPARCIWLTEEEARSRLLYPRWLAAPADAAEAMLWGSSAVISRDQAHEILLALGYPHTEQA